ncbi:DUF2798 domain-containing protein [Shewanella sp.]|uniref:DUF2798 domain-containing protein n=1 Tax=Shewanella sp. TaxID=50422 RepID=UPI003A97FE58
MTLKKLAITLPAPLCIVSCLSCFMTYLNHGMSDDFFLQWLKALVFSLIVMLPLAGLLIIKIGQFVEGRFANLSSLKQKLLQCGLIALSLELILSAVNTLSVVPLTNIEQFLTSWLFTLVKAYPLGYIIAMIMVFLVKPRIQRSLAAV